MHHDILGVHTITDLSSMSHQAMTFSFLTSAQGYFRKLMRADAAKEATIS